MAYWGWKSYVSAADRRRMAEKAAAKATKAGAKLSPVAPYRGSIAKTFWGKAWCENLERYRDYANRLPRGRTYLRNGSVIDLQITAGEVRAQVLGSSLYQVDVTVRAVSAKHWQSIGTDCAASIDSMVELLQGNLSQAVMERICRPSVGLFPAPADIKFSCSCPDWASMCKHVAAVLYGVASRLDHQPELLFDLRRVDARELVAQAGAGLPRKSKHLASSRVLADSALADVFGIEMAAFTAPKKASPPRRRAPAAKTAKAAKTEKQLNAPRKSPGGKTAVKAKTPGKVSAQQRTVVSKRNRAGPAQIRPRKER
jgi:uncharacterized Zn finger protein